MVGCAAINCSNSSKNCRLFIFPSDPLRRAKWVQNMQRDKFTPTRGTRLCEIHFDENQWENKRSDGWRKLKPFAVPTIFQAPEPPKRLASVRKTRIKQPAECLQIEIVDGPEINNSTSENKESKKCTKSQRQLIKREESVDTSVDESTCGGSPKDDSQIARGGFKGDRFSSSFSSPLRKRRLIDYDKKNEDSPDENTDIPTNMERKNLLLCRICCMKDLPLIFIHKETKLHNSQDVTVVEMLTKYLPIEINMDDEFPLYVCSNCIDTLNKWHDLYTSCVAADRTFKNIHHRERNQEIMEVADRRGRQDFGYVRVENISSVPEEGQHSSVTDKLTPLKESKDHQNRKGQSMCTRCKCAVRESEDFREKIHSDFLKNLKTGFRKVCIYCSESFVDYDELKAHCVTCKDTPTVCEMCGKLIPSRRELLKHKTILHSPLVICDKCGKSMAQRHLYRHMQAAHFPLQSSCLGCCKIFRTKFHYNEHMRKHAKGMIKAKFSINPVVQNEKRYFVCPVCKQSFNVKLSLVKHLTKTKLIKCNTCHKKLTCEKNVLTHQCQKYSCKYCSKCFYRKNRWEKHEEGHTGKNSSNGQFLQLHQNSSTARNTTPESCVFFS